MWATSRAHAQCVEHTAEARRPFGHAVQLPCAVAIASPNLDCVPHTLKHHFLLDSRACSHTLLAMPTQKRCAIFACCLGSLLAAPRVRADTPSEIRVESTCPRPDVFVIVRHAAVPDPEIAALPESASQVFREYSRRLIAAHEANHAYELSRSDADRVRRDETQRSYSAVEENLLSLLEHDHATLTAEAWLFVAQLRLGVALDRIAHAPGAEYGEGPTIELDLRPVLDASRRASALGGTNEVSMWARYFEAQILARSGLMGAIDALRIVVAHSTGELLAHALLDLANLYGEANEIALSNVYIDRALPLLRGEDVTTAHIVTFLNNVGFDPSRSFEHAVLYLRELRDAAPPPQGAIAFVGESVRTGPPTRRTRVLAELPESIARRVICAADFVSPCPP